MLGSSTETVYLAVEEDFSTRNNLQVIKKLGVVGSQVSLITSGSENQLRGTIQKIWKEVDLIRLDMSQGLD